MHPGHREAFAHALPATLTASDTEADSCGSARGNDDAASIHPWLQSRPDPPRVPVSCSCPGSRKSLLPCDGSDLLTLRSLEGERPQVHIKVGNQSRAG